MNRLVLLVLLAPALAAAAPSTIDPKAQAWHRELEAVGDYGENWFLALQTRDGGTLVTQLFVTNLGLRTFDGGYDVSWYPARGEGLALHGEVSRDAIASPQTGLDLRVGPARLRRAGDTVLLELTDGDVSLKVALEPELPPFQSAERSVLEVEAGRWWKHGVDFPRARATGTLRKGGTSIDLTGLAELDHAWSTIKLPTLLTSWRTLRLHGQRHTLVLHDQSLASRWGGRSSRFGMLGRDGALVASLRDFEYRVVRSAHDEVSDQDYPAELALDASSGGWRVRGRISSLRMLESLDVLGRLSWPVRTAIKAFYSSPYSLRYLARCELEVTGPDGLAERLDGDALLEANFY